MDSVLQYIFITLVLSLMCTCTFTTLNTEWKDAKTLFDQCEFDPKFVYTTTSTFKVNASNLFNRSIQWTYNFDVRNQTVSLKHERRGSPKETQEARLNYKTNKMHILCARADNEDDLIIDLFGSHHKLPSTFPPDDTKPCHVTYHDRSKVVTYYSKDYDFWFSINVTSPGQCQMQEIVLPGQVPPNLYYCLFGKDLDRRFWMKICPKK